MRHVHSLLMKFRIDALILSVRQYRVLTGAMKQLISMHGSFAIMEFIAANACNGFALFGRPTCSIIIVIVGIDFL